MQEAQKQSKKVKGYFDAIAGRYDLMNTLLSFGLHHFWKRTAIIRAGLTPGDIVLDVCGGTGDLAVRAAAAAGATGLVVVYDFSVDMMQAGTEKIKHTPFHRSIVSVCGDAQNMAVRENTCDAVLIGFGLRNLPDMATGLREMYRVLKPGGTLLCLEFSRPVNFFFRLLYDLYSYYAIPFAGKVITGSREAYTYLPDSIRRFPLPDQLATIMMQAGFSDVRYTRLTNGIAALHVAIKKA